MNVMHIIDISSLQQITPASERFLKVTKGHKKFAFTGVMGSGKTTFITALCRRLGIKNPVTSPSFALINEYHTASGEVIFHFDFFRIKSITEAFDLGYEEYFFSNAWCFIEWAEKAAEILPEEFIAVNIEVMEDNTRRITIDLKD
jgi:tRNA threonylcarbamoyladenosine biosynthesis protein TsaE